MSRHQCPASAELHGWRYQCERHRGHAGLLHFSLMGRFDMVQWPDGWGAEP